MDREKKEAGFGAIVMNLFRRLWVVFIFAAICGFGMYMLATKAITPKYDSDIRLYINSGDTSDDLVDVCGAVLESEGVLSEIIDQAKLEYTTEELDKMLSYRDVNSTNMIEITVRSADSEEAAEIANFIAYILPERAEDVIYESKVSVLQFATVPKEPAFPSVGSFTLLGMIIGVILACIVITLVYILDDAIKDREYLEKTFGIPVLAYIPEYTADKTEDGENEDSKEETK